MNCGFYREPVKVLEDGGDVTEGWSSDDNMGSRNLDQLELVEGIERELQ